MISITDAFDGGNIIVKNSGDPSRIELEIRKDKDSDFYQWFYFKLAGAKGEDCRLQILNAGNSAYPGGWDDYRAVATYDRKSWFRVPTLYRDGQLAISVTPKHDQIYLAYFAPYTMEQHHQLIADMSMRENVRLDVLGNTLDGQTIDLLTVGNEDPAGQIKKHRYWVTARQHPGETMAEWWMEGFVDRLTDTADPVARALLNQAIFYIVPNMNPDGSRRGHLRTNAAGINLNREWQSPSLEKSPEVHHVLSHMRKTGVDFALDVHGDEALPYNFIAGCEGVPSFTEKGDALLQSYKSALKVASPDFQTKYGYPRNPPGKANLKICANAIGEEFGCLSMTLEMPFKDSAISPDQRFGWSPERCKLLGRANLDAMLQVVGELR